VLGFPSLGIWGALLVWVERALPWGVSPAGGWVCALGKYLDPAGDRISMAPRTRHKGTKISGDRPRGLAAQWVVSDLATCGPVQDVLAQGILDKIHH